MRFFAGIRTLMVCAAVSGLVSVASANIWVEENFDDGSLWTQGNGVLDPPNAIPSANLDVFENDRNDKNFNNLPFDPLVTPFGSILTATGTLSPGGAFNGTDAYKLAVGQTITAGTPYHGQTNGDFCYLQFAAQFSTIPPAGDCGNVDWTIAINSVDITYTVKFVSTGSAVNILAGLSGGSLVQIGTLASATDWKFITMRLMNGTASGTDAKAVIIPAEQTKSSGMYFYCSSDTPGHSEAFVSSTTKLVKGWNFNVAAGEMRVDALYYDGGMDAGSVSAISRLKSFSTAPQDLSGVSDWMLLN